MSLLNDWYILSVDPTCCEYTLENTRTGVCCNETINKIDSQNQVVTFDSGFRLPYRNVHGNTIKVDGSFEAWIGGLQSQVQACKIAQNEGEDPNDITDKQYVGIRNFYPTDQENLPPEKRDCIEYDAWILNGEWCYFPLGENPSTENQISETILNTLTMAGEKLGGLAVIKSEIKTRKGRTLEICGGAEGREVLLADLDAIAATEIAELTEKIVPDDGYEWARLGIEINQHPAKKKIFCDLAGAEGTVTSNEQGHYAFGTDVKQYFTVGDTRDTIVKQLPNADACGCLDNPACLSTDADYTVPITLEPNTGIELCQIYVCVKSAAGGAEEKAEA